MAEFEGVILSSLSEKGETKRTCHLPLTFVVSDETERLILKFKNAVKNGPKSVFEIHLQNDEDTAAVGTQSYVITKDGSSLLIQFSEKSDFQRFHQIVQKFKKRTKDSAFSQRTDDASAVQYFQFYGYLSQQQNMMQDYIRTSTYQRAILSNVEDFKDKVVLDVGAGSGILSFFAIQAGAKKVYAIEASSMARHAETLVYHNKLSEKIIVVPGKIEEISLPVSVDVIISEPMGYMLFNERMLETYLHAKKWLASNGKMFPTRGDLHIAPFTDAALFMEQINKANFWYQHSFHGVDLSSLRDAAVEEYFRQPVVDTFDIRICLAKSLSYTVDFETSTECDLHKIEIPLTFDILQSGEIHGLAFWFDVAFIGSTHTVWLSTSPTQPLTHWYQVRCLIHSPLIVQKGQVVTGMVVLNSNPRQSYDVDIELKVEETGVCSRNSLDLKNPFFRYTGQPLQPPPGFNETSPSESYWETLDAQNATNNVNLMVNGIALMNGNTVMDVQSIQNPQPTQLGVHNSNLISLDSATCGFREYFSFPS